MNLLLDSVFLTVISLCFLPSFSLLYVLKFCTFLFCPHSLASLTHTQQAGIIFISLSFFMITLTSHGRLSRLLVIDLKLSGRLFTLHVR